MRYLEYRRGFLIYKYICNQNIAINWSAQWAHLCKRLPQNTTKQRWTYQNHPHRHEKLVQPGGIFRGWCILTFINYLNIPSGWHKLKRQSLEEYLLFPFWFMIFAITRRFCHCNIRMNYVYKKLLTNTDELRGEIVQRK